MLEDTDIICPKCSEVQPDFSNGEKPNEEPGQNEASGQNEAPKEASAGQGSYTQPGSSRPDENRAGGYRAQGPAAPYQPPRPQPDNVSPSSEMTPYLIWGIVLIFLCMPFGLASTIICAVSYNVRSRFELEKNKRLARILCIIGTVFGALFILVYVVLIVFFCGAIFSRIPSANPYNYMPNTN